MTARRRLTSTVLSCLAGAGLALFAVTRTWSEIVTARPGLSSLRSARTGADVEPWVIGLALVGLAGAGALLATRGVARRILGALLAAAGAGVVAGAIAGRVGLEVGSAGAGATFWPVVCAVGGLLIFLGGLSAVRYGHEWPGMGARYERKPAGPAPDLDGPASDRDRTAPGRTGTDSAQRVDTRAVWDALDRGDDPTAR